MAYLVFRDPDWNIYEVLQAAFGLLLIIMLCNRFLPFVFFSRTKGEWLKRWTLVLKALIYLVMPVTIVLGFLQSVATLTRENTTEEPETSAEAVDALIEAGQEEGIIQEGDRDLIQSVVEFSGKTVREAMKPRPAIFAVPTDTTVERFIEMLRAKHYSRVPVYEGSIHNIKGVVYTQDVLQVPDSEAHVRRLDSIMRRDVYFVPESKLGSDLLREMQKQNIRMAIVVDEYGGVAGLVTIEDLVEEIVGEIRDERDKPEIFATATAPSLFREAWTWTASTNCSAPSRKEKNPRRLQAWSASLPEEFRARANLWRKTAFALRCWSQPIAKSNAYGLRQCSRSS